MTINYSIASTLVVKDELTACLEKIAAIGKIVNAQMSELAKNIGKLDKGFQKAGSSADGFASKQSRAFNDMAQNANRAQAATANLNRELAVVNSRSMSSSTIARSIISSNAEPILKIGGFPLGDGSSVGKSVPPSRLLPVFGGGLAGNPGAVSTIASNQVTRSFAEPPRIMRDIGGSSIAGGNALANAGGAGGRNGGGLVGNVNGNQGARYAGGAGGGAIPPGGAGGGAIPPGGAGGGAQPNPNGGMNAMAAGYVGNMMRETGMGILDSLKAPIEQAIELERITASLRQKGLGNDQIADALKFSKATEIYGTSIIERTRIFNEAQGSFRESGMAGKQALEAAKTMMPVLAGYQVAMATLDEKTHAAAEGSFNQLNKIVELMGGLTDKERAQSIADSVFKAVQSSGKMINERDIRAFITQGGSAASNLSDKSVFASLEPLMGEFGGYQLGTGMSTAYRNLAGMMSHPTRMMVGEATKLGIWDKEQIVYNSQGGIKSIKNRDKLTDASTMDLMQHDTARFVRKLMSTYQTHGIDTPEKRERENEILLGRTGAKVYNKMMRQIEVMERSGIAYDNAQGIGQTNAAGKDSPMQKIAEMQKRYNDLLLQLGIIVLPMAIKALGLIIPVLSAAAHWIDRHRELTKILVGAMVGLAGAMAIGGTVLVLRAGFTGLGIAINLLTNGTGVPALGIALGAIISPIGIAVLAIGTIAAACYAFRGLSVGEINSAKTDGGAQLTPEARARASALGWKNYQSNAGIKDIIGGKKDASFDSFRAPQSSNNSPDGLSALIAASIKSALNGTAVKMDGETVGLLVTDKMGREASMPSTGTSGFDSRLGPLRPDYGH
jgi:hypothetical protein